MDDFVDKSASTGPGKFHAVCRNIILTDVDLECPDRIDEWTCHILTSRSISRMSACSTRRAVSANLVVTSRLTLREVVADDAYAFRDYMTEDAYWRDLPIDPPTLSSIRDYLERCIRDQADEPRRAWFLAAIETSSGRLVGEGILHVRSRRWRQGEIGWGVDPARTGAGLATEIAGAMLRLAFEGVGLHRVVARCRVGHVASRRIMEKLGMQEEGVLREDVCARGTWWDSVQCAILADEWRRAEGG